MFKTEGNDVTDVTIYRTLWMSMLAGCVSNEFKITHDHVKNTIHQGLSQGIFKKIYTKGLDSENSNTLCFL